MPRHIWIVNFEQYNPPHKLQNSESRGKPLKWVRLQTNWADDLAIVTMPEAGRWLWPALFALAGESTPPGRVDGTPAELALRWRTTETRVAEALDHLWRKGRIRYSSGVAARHLQGGGEVA